jgi:hypothetical protein
VGTKKNAVYWDVTPCGSCTNRRFGETYHLHHQSDKNWEARNNISNVVPSLLSLVTLMMKAIPSSETSVFTRVTLLNIPEDGILQVILLSVCGRELINNELTIDLS